MNVVSLYMLDGLQADVVDHVAPWGRKNHSS